MATEGEDPALAAPKATLSAAANAAVAMAAFGGAGAAAPGAEREWTAAAAAAVAYDGRRHGDERWNRHRGGAEEHG